MERPPPGGQPSIHNDRFLANLPLLSDLTSCVSTMFASGKKAGDSEDGDESTGMADM